VRKAGSASYKLDTYGDANRRFRKVQGQITAQYVAYYWVSTDKQGIKGLGMDAQREAVAGSWKGQLAGEFIEVESGRKENRFQLSPPSRNAVSAAPSWSSPSLTAWRVTSIHILAAVAEHEREMISQRTKAALSAAKARGTKLGNPRGAEAVAIAREARTIQAPAPEVMKLMTEWKG
jgi:DNA invertase Pin-like site-specific DNA recombinase